MTVDNRTRNWTFLVYPDSAPEHWIDGLRDLNLCGFVSPLHDADKTADESQKKPHWHVALVHSGNKSLKQIQEISDLFSGVLPQPVSNLRSLGRYFCHMDNPSKAQYSPSDVVTIGGYDFLGLIGTAADTDKTLSAIEDFIDDKCIVSYAELCKYARREKPEWTRVIRTHTFHLSAYVKSRNWEYCLMDEKRVLLSSHIDKQADEC